MPLALSGRLTTPFGDPLPNATIRFDAVRTSGAVLSYTNAEATTDSGGDYAISVEYGTYDIRVKTGQSFYTLATSVQIKSDTTAADLNGLIVEAQGYDNLTPQIIVEFRALTADAEQYRDESRAARDESRTARDDSQLAQGLSEQAREASYQNRAASEQARNESRTARDASQSAQSASELASNESAAAKASSEDASVLSQQYRNESRTARDASQSAQAESQAIYDAVSPAQAQTNALLGLGIGSSYVDANGNLIMTYNAATVGSVDIDADGFLTITY